MKYITLKYFKVLMEKEDVFDKYGYKQPLDPIFNATVRHCKAKGWSDSFSMDEIFGFRMTGYEHPFYIHSITVNDVYSGKRIGPMETMRAIVAGHPIEILFIERINDILK